MNDDLNPPRRPRGSDVTPPAAQDGGDAVPAAAVARAYVEEVSLEAALAAAPRYDGGTTSFTLARPLVRDHQVIPEGTVVTFNVMPHPELRGIFIGDETSYEAEHVMDLYRLGMFAMTGPAVDRTRKQNAIDTERGVYEGVDGGPPLVSLGALDGAQTVAMLRRHHGIGTPEQMLAAERQAARTEEPARVQQRVWAGAQRPRQA
jgi:hypothetical protein